MLILAPWQTNHIQKLCLYKRPNMTPQYKVQKSCLNTCTQLICITLFLISRQQTKKQWLAPEEVKALLFERYTLLGFLL